ncbi:MAG: zinc ribbon domain-containing protein [Fidelibacterota bacterium]
MPIYDYHCKNCDTDFEELVFSSLVPDEEITCPQCNKNEAQRQLSAPMISTGSTGSSDSHSGGCNAPSGFS